MKLLKKLVTAAIAGCMALSLSACSDTTWVYEFDGEKIPSGLYIGYTISAYSQVSQQEGYDANIKDIFKQTINGKSTDQWIKDTAKQECAMYAVYEKKFNELGLSFSEDDISALDSSLKSNWDSLGTVYEKNGVSKASYRKLLESSKRESMIFSKYYGEGGLEEVKKEDLLAHFKENFASVNIFRMALYTGSDLTDEQKKSNEKTKTDSEKYLKMLNEEGKTFGETYDQYYHDVLGTTHDAENDQDVITEDSESTTWVKKNDTSRYSEKVLSTIFNELKPDGDAMIIADTNYYYIVKRYDVTKDEKNFDEMRESVLYDIKGDDFKKMAEGWASEMKTVVNNAAVSRYKPKHIDLTTDTK